LTKVIAIIHSNRYVIDLLMKEVLADLEGVQVINLLDEGIVSEIRGLQRLSPAVYRKVYDMVESATDSAAVMVLCSCSSISPVVTKLQPFFSIPILSIDGLFFREIVKKAGRLIVFGTASFVLRTVRQGLEKAARLEKKEIQVKTVLCSAMTEHISLVEYYQYLAEEIKKNLTYQDQEVFDSALLAQLSMVPALAYIPKNLKTGVQYAIPYAITNIKRVLSKLS